jgi:hypothetical protein
VFALKDTINPGAIFFKILTSFPGGMTHLSPLVQTTVACGNAYTISEQAAPTNPQSVAFGGTTNGFVLPVYISSQ